MWTSIAVVVIMALPCSRCRCEGLGMDFCLDKQSFFHEDTDLDEQADPTPDERQLPTKPKPTTVETKDQDHTSRRYTQKDKDNNTSTTSTTTHKPEKTDKYDESAILAKFAEEEDVVREDHVTQTQYLSDLAVNTDNEITSLHVDDDPQQTFNLAGGDRETFFAFASDDEPSMEVDGVWSRVPRDIHSSDSDEPSSEESDEIE